MGAGILCISARPQRVAAIKAAAATIDMPFSSGSDGKGTDHALKPSLVFLDADLKLPKDADLASSAVVLMYDPTDSREAKLAFTVECNDTLSFPAGQYECTVRIKALSRLKMLRDEVASRSIGTGLAKPVAKPRVALLGSAKAQDELAADVSSHLDYVCAADDVTGLYDISASEFDVIILAVETGASDPALLVQQMRLINSTRDTPVLIVGDPDSALVQRCHAAGAADIVTPSEPMPALLKRVTALRERSRLLVKLKSVSTHAANHVDVETGLPNALELNRIVQIGLPRAAAQGKQASLLMIGVDQADGSNTEPQLTESALRALTKELRRSLRGFDFACRYSEDVFAIFMPATPQEGAEAAAKRLCADIEKQRIRCGAGHSKEMLTCSIGVSNCGGTQAALPEAAFRLITAAAAALASARTIGVSHVAMAA
jgi:two-component system, cell cycle response regulator